MPVSVPLALTGPVPGSESVASPVLVPLSLSLTVVMLLVDVGSVGDPLADIDPPVPALPVTPLDVPSVPELPALPASVAALSL